MVNINRNQDSWQLSMTWWYYSLLFIKYCTIIRIRNSHQTSIHIYIYIRMDPLNFKRSLFGSNPSMHGCRFLACLQTCTTWLWRPGTDIPSCYAVMDVLWPSGMMATRTPRSSTNWWQEVQVCATFMGPIGYLRISKSLQSYYRNLWLYWMSLERRIATFTQGCLSDGG